MNMLIELVTSILHDFYLLTFRFIELISTFLPPDRSYACLDLQCRLLQSKTHIFQGSETRA